LNETNVGDKNEDAVALAPLQVDQMFPITKILRAAFSYEYVFRSFYNYFLRSKKSRISFFGFVYAEIYLFSSFFIFWENNCPLFAKFE